MSTACVVLMTAIVTREEWRIKVGRRGDQSVTILTLLILYLWPTLLLLTLEGQALLCELLG